MLFIPVMIGLFVASEAFRLMEQNQQIRQGRRWLSAVCYRLGKTLRRTALTILRSSGLGVLSALFPRVRRILRFVAITKLVVCKTPETLVRGEIKAVASP